MPKRVDHEERRRQIADALVRTAATRGLHAAGMREVAAEAGVSLRLVQYYFGTKEELLLAAMQNLAARYGERAVARFREAGGSGGPASPRDIIAAILAEALPADEERRTFTIVYTAYLALSLTDPALAITPLVKNSGAVIDVVCRPVASRPGRRRHASPPGPGPGSPHPDDHVRGPRHERHRRPVLSRASSSRHRLPPVPPVPRISASVTPSAHEKMPPSRGNGRGDPGQERGRTRQEPGLVRGALAGDARRGIREERRQVRADRLAGEQQRGQNGV